MTWCRAHKSQDPAHTVNPQRHFWGPIWILNKKNHGYRSEIGFISLLIQLLISLLILSLRDRIRIILASGSKSRNIFFGSNLDLEQKKMTDTDLKSDFFHYWYSHWYHYWCLPEVTGSMPGSTARLLIKRIRFLIITIIYETVGGSGIQMQVS